MRKILLTFLSALLCSVTAWGANGDVLFSQNFNSATAVAYAASTARTYTVASADNNIVGSTAASQFTYIAVTSKSNVGIAINSSTGGGTKVDATGFFQAYCANTGHKYSLVKTTNFAATAPKAIKVSMKLWFQQGSSGSDYSATFAIGDDFSDGTANPAASNVHSGFSILNNSTAKITSYASKTAISENGITQGSWLNITWVINNSGETLTYTNPNSTSETLANDTYDLWIGTTKYVNDQAASTATKDLQNLYIGDPAGKYHQLRLDDIVVTDLTPSSCAATAPGNISKGSACAGENLTLTSAGSPASGDTWYWQASSTGTSTTNSGATYDVSSAGTYYVRSYNTSGTCWSDAKSVTVAAGDWTSPSISGASSVTVGNTITLTGSPSGGTWDSSDETKATVNSSGVVTGVAAGNVNITYSKDGCTSDNHAVTVSAVVCSPSISASPSSANYCKDDVATALSFTGSGHNAQKWQRSTDGGSSWSDIDGATNATYTPSTSATGSTQYRVVTTCDSYTTTATSSAATVTVKTSPNLTISLN